VHFVGSYIGLSQCTVQKSENGMS